MIKICLQGNKFLFLKLIMCYSHKQKKQPGIPASLHSGIRADTPRPEAFFPRLLCPPAEGTGGRDAGTVGGGCGQPKAGGWLPWHRWTGHHPLLRVRLAVSPMGRRGILSATVRSRNGTSYLSHLPCGLVLLWDPRLLALWGAGLPL